MSDLQRAELPGWRRMVVAAAGLALLAVATLAAVHFTAPGMPDLDTARERATQRGLYTVSIAPEGAEPTVGPLHAWIVTVKTADGMPVSGATLSVDGGMPEHDHGLPTRPAATAAPEQGRYRVEGVKFTMPGRWVLRLTIAAAAGKDDVAFNLRL